MFGSDFVNYSKLNDNEKKILAILEDNPFVPQQHIADEIHLSRSATANLLSGLVDKGFLLGRAYVPNNAGQVLCIGGANQDMKVKVDQMPDRGTSNAGNLELTFGGVMRNVCENLGRLEVRASMLTLVGDDPQGHRILKELGVWSHVGNSEVLPDSVTGHYIAILTDDGDLITGFADMQICERMDAQWIMAHKKHIMQSDWVLADCNLTQEAIATLLRLCTKFEKKLVLIGVSDFKMGRVPKDVQGLYLAIVNRQESQAYFGVEDTMEGYVRRWLAEGVENVIITAGSEPVWYGTIDGIFSVNVPALQRPEIVDVTGCGDALSGGVIYALTQGKKLDEALMYGIINARHTIQSEDSVRKELVRQTLEDEVRDYEQSLFRD